jgi:hypothetical protein
MIERSLPISRPKIWLGSWKIGKLMKSPKLPSARPLLNVRLLALRGRRPGRRTLGDFGRAQISRKPGPGPAIVGRNPDHRLPEARRPCCRSKAPNGRMSAPRGRSGMLLISVMMSAMA